MLTAELWQPTIRSGGYWTTMNAMHVPRLYHSTAVLLPDATVLCAGGGQGGGYQDHPDYEIFTPPYLCKGLTRPLIELAPAAVAYGQVFTVKSADATSITRATWVRLSSVTHSFDMNQRFADLNPVYNSAQPGELTITAPPDRNLYPPGHYMLFLIDNQGTPSLASIVAINDTGCNTVLSINRLTISVSPCSHSLRLTATGGGTSPYAWTVNGTPSGTGPSIDITVTNAFPTTLVRVEQNTSCGASTSFTTFFPNCADTSRAAPRLPSLN